MYKGLMPVAVLIVEDDLSFALELEMLVQETGYNVVGVVESSAAALDIIYSEQVDFILMDINIKGLLSGLELGKKILPLKIPILYITSLNSELNYEQAQMSNFAGYLVKPIDKYTLITAISLSIGQLVPNHTQSERSESIEEFIFGEFLFLKKNNVYHKVPERDIALVEGAGDYVNITLSDGRVFLLRKTLQTMADILSDAVFIRVHRSYLVNATAIDHLDTLNNCLCIGDKTIPLSRQRRLELEKRIRMLD